MTAGAADGDGHIGAVAGGKAWQPLVQIRVNVGVHLIHISLCRQVVDDRLIQPRVGAQVRLLIRIGQAAYVEHQVGIYRHAALEAK